MGDRAAFRLELFSRGGNPQSPIERVFELPCPGLPADARVFGILRSDGADTTATLASLIRNAIRSIETLNRRTLASGLEGKFEAILLAVNRGYTELAAGGTVPKSPLPDALFGMIVEQDLFLTGHGAVEAFLLRPSEGGQPRRLLEKETEHTNTAGTLFRTIVSGTLKPSDTLLVTVSGLFNYLALPHVSRVLSTLPVRDARTRILELLGDVPSTVPLSGIIVGPPPADVARPAHAPTLFRRSAAPATKTAPAPTKPNLLQTYGPSVAAAARKGATILQRTLLQGLKRAPSVAKGAITFLREPSARGGMLRRTKALPDRCVAWWNTLPARSKFLCITGVLFVLLFGEGLRFLLRAQQQEALIGAYNQAVAAIQTQRDAAEASMIYKNEAAAWQQLVDAEAAVRALPQQTDTQKKTAQDLLTQIETDREKLRHHVSIEKTLPLFSLPEDAGTGTTLFTGKTLITVVSDTGGAWNWDKTKKSLRLANVPFLADRAVQRALLGSRGLLFFTGEDIVERVATETIHTTITLPTTAAVAATTLWKERVYALVPSANQVYRGTKNGNTWNLTVPALKNPSVTGGTDIAIDTAVWISTSSTIHKYLAGEDQRFSLKPFDPPPQQLTRIWLGAESDPLLTYDAGRKRLLVINKDGSLRTQFSNGPVDDLRDAAIDSTNNSILLLTSRAVFELPMPE
jgi:hypothetical protein